MSYNGSGTFVINTSGQPVVSGTVITTTAFNALTADLATGLTTALTKDGQTTPTGNIKLGTYKITDLGAGTAATDAVNVSQIQTNAVTYLTVSGVDTILGSASPPITAYVAGQAFRFKVAGDNTGPVTLNVDSLGAKTVNYYGTTALGSAALRNGSVVSVAYDGTQFQILGGAASAGVTTGKSIALSMIFGF